MSADERWNEVRCVLEISCPTCGTWFPKFEKYPRRALCPRRAMKKHPHPHIHARKIADSRFIGTLRIKESFY